MKTTLRTLKVTANHSAQTFTIRTSTGLKYKTCKQSEFKSMLYMTENDWNQFLKTDDYYIVK